MLEVVIRRHDRAIVGKPMTRMSRIIIRGLAICAFVCCAASISQAATIIKLSLGEVGADVGMNNAGILSTVNDGNVTTTGDQNTAVEYTAFLDSIPDITTKTASFSLNNLAAAGPATVFGSTVIQNFLGGTFNLYDPANVLLLSGALTNSELTGTIGAPGTGAVFTTTFGTVTGGTLAPLIQPGSISLSMDLTTVNGGAGFSVGAAAPILNPFLADASVNIAADQIVPEPTSLALLLLGAGATARRRLRR